MVGATSARLSVPLLCLAAISCSTSEEKWAASSAGTDGAGDPAGATGGVAAGAPGTALAGATNGGGTDRPVSSGSGGTDWPSRSGSAGTGVGGSSGGTGAASWSAGAGSLSGGASGSTRTAGAAGLAASAGTAGSAASAGAAGRGGASGRAGAGGRDSADATAGAGGAGGAVESQLICGLSTNASVEPATTCQGLEGPYVVRPPDSESLSVGDDWSIADPIYVAFREDGGSCRAIVNVEYFEPAPYAVQAADGVLRLVPETDGAFGTAYFRREEVGLHRIDSITLAAPGNTVPTCARVELSWARVSGEYDWGGSVIVEANLDRGVPPVSFVLRRLEGSVWDYGRLGLDLENLPLMSDPNPVGFPWSTWVLQASRPVASLADHLGVVASDGGQALPATIEPIEGQTWVQVRFSDWPSVNGASFEVVVDDSLVDSLGEPAPAARFEGNVVELSPARRAYEFESADEVWFDRVPSLAPEDQNVVGLYGGQLHVSDSGGPLPCQAAGLLDASDASTVHFTGSIPAYNNVRIIVPGVEEVQARDAGGGDYTPLQQSYPWEVEYSSVAGQDLVGFCLSVSHGSWIDLDSIWVVE